METSYKLVLITNSTYFNPQKTTYPLPQPPPPSIQCWFFATNQACCFNKSLEISRTTLNLGVGGGSLAKKPISYVFLMSYVLDCGSILIHLARSSEIAPVYCKQQIRLTYCAVALFALFLFVLSVSLRFFTSISSESPLM